MAKKSLFSNWRSKRSLIHEPIVKPYRDWAIISSTAFLIMLGLIGWYAVAALELLAVPEVSAEDVVEASLKKVSARDVEAAAAVVIDRQAAFDARMISPSGVIADPSL